MATVVLVHSMLCVKGNCPEEVKSVNLMHQSTCGGYESVVSHFCILCSTAVSWTWANCNMPPYPLELGSYVLMTGCEACLLPRCVLALQQHCFLPLTPAAYLGSQGGLFTTARATPATHPSPSRHPHSLAAATQILQAQPTQVGCMHEEPGLPEYGV